MSELDPRHAEYNAFVQRVQSDCRSWRAEYRFYYARRADGRSLYPARAVLQVYWNGEWHGLASEIPFVSADERDARFDEMAWTNLQSEMADALVTS